MKSLILFVMFAYCVIIALALSHAAKDQNPKWHFPKFIWEVTKGLLYASTGICI